MIGGWLDTSVCSDHSWPRKDRHESCKEPMSLSKHHLADSPLSPASITDCAYKLSSCAFCASRHTFTPKPLCPTAKFLLPKPCCYHQICQCRCCKTMELQIWRICDTIEVHRHANGEIPGVYRIPLVSSGS